MKNGCELIFILERVVKLNLVLICYIVLRFMFKLNIFYLF